MKVLDWLFAARPLLHLPAWSIFLVALHDHHQLAGKQFGGTEIPLLLILSLCAAAALYLNQVYDLESDRTNRKLGFFQSGAAVLPHVQSLVIFLSLAALTLAVFVSARTVALVVQWQLLAYLYSVPPFRLKDRPWWGLFANGFGVGWLTAFLVMPELSFHNAGQLGWDNPQYFFFAVAGVTALTTIPDRQGDERTGKQTVAVRFGPRMTAAIATTSFLLAAFFAYGHSHLPQLVLAFIAAVVSAFGMAIPNESLYRFAAKLPILLLTLLAGWYYPLYLLFIIALIICTRLYYRTRYAQQYPSFR